MSGDKGKAPTVMPAKAGIHAESEWTPAYAGVTERPEVVPS
jgi:hypothetical protein